VAPAPKMKILMVSADCITVTEGIGASRDRENPELHCLRDSVKLTE